MPWHWKPTKDVISCGKEQISDDPQISEWGNSLKVMLKYPILNQIGIEKETRGTETSKYPEEEKETSISWVAASEREGA